MLLAMPRMQLSSLNNIVIIDHAILDESKKPEQLIFILHDNNPHLFV